MSLWTKGHVWCNCWSFGSPCLMSPCPVASAFLLSSICIFFSRSSLSWDYRENDYRGTENTIDHRQYQCLLCHNCCSFLSNRIYRQSHTQFMCHTKEKKNCFWIEYHPKRHSHWCHCSQGRHDLPLKTILLGYPLSLFDVTVVPSNP